MTDRSRTRVKICGITNIDDAHIAIRYGADALGFIFFNKSDRNISLKRAQVIVESLPPFVDVVALFVNANPENVCRIIESLDPNILQFHGDESPAFCDQFGKPYIRAIRMHKNTDLIQSVSNYASAKGILLDTYVDGKEGGSGLAFDWALIPKKLDVPVILAGGLNPGNISRAIRLVRPWAVDVSSGVERSPGLKDKIKLKDFFQGVRDANE